MYHNNLSAQDIADRDVGLSVETVENIILGKHELDLRTIAILDTILGGIADAIFHAKVFSTIDEIVPPEHMMTFECDADTQWFSLSLQSPQPQ